MKANTLIGRLRVFAAVLLATVLLGGCEHMQQSDGLHKEMPLDDVVEALQYAIETAARDKAWEATAGENKHWSEACVIQKKNVAAACFAMFNKAIPLCQQACSGSNCSPTGQRQCERLIKGESVDQLCLSSVAGAEAEWCTTARSCNEATKASAQVCENAATIVMPELEKAEVTLSVERKTEAAGSIDILIVSFGGGRSESASNTVTMTLKPRIRDVNYDSTQISPLPDVKAISPRVRALADGIAKSIANAVAASVKEYEGTAKGVPMRGPVHVSDLEVSFSLTVEDNGTLGIKKAWSTPAGIELSGGRSSKRANTLTVTYARPK